MSNVARCLLQRRSRDPHWKLDIELWDFIGIWDLDMDH
jgi:hypothetical protein